MLMYLFPICIRVNFVSKFFILIDQHSVSLKRDNSSCTTKKFQSLMHHLMYTTGTPIVSNMWNPVALVIIQKYIYTIVALGFPLIYCNITLTVGFFSWY